MDIETRDGGVGQGTEGDQGGRGEYAVCLISITNQE